MQAIINCIVDNLRDTRTCKILPYLEVERAKEVESAGKGAMNYTAFTKEGLNLPDRTLLNCIMKVGGAKEGRGMCGRLAWKSQVPKSWVAEILGIARSCVWR